MRRLVPLLLTALAVLAVPSAAGAFTFVKTPSGNIGCAFYAAGGKQVRCDILQTDNAVPSPPATCEGDYGHAFGVKRRGRPHRLCVGDTVFDPKARVLDYGESITRYGIRCTSRERGLVCRNRSGHGFRLSRQSQRLF
jgi:hypothetical protein